MDHLCRSHSGLSATDWLFHPPLNSLRCSPSVPTDFPIGEGASPDAGNSSLLQLPLRGTDPIPLPLLFFSLLSFVLPSYVGIFLVLTGVQGLLLVFSQCSVRILPSVDVFLIHLWREINSTSPTPPPSWFPQD